MNTTYVVDRVDRDSGRSLRIRSRWHHMPGRVVSVVLMVVLVLVTLVSPPMGPLLRWLFALPFLLLIAADLFFFRQQRVVFLDARDRYVAIRDRLRIPVSPVDESRISFDDIRGVGTVRMTASDPMSSHRMVTLHLDGHDRYLITVPGRWEHRDLEREIQATIGLERLPPSDDVGSSSCRGQ